MQFVWNAWSPLNLAIDLAILASSAWCVWRVRHSPGLASRLPSAALEPVGVGIGLALWLAFGVAMGGIMGLCLIARALWVVATVAVPAHAAIALARGRSKLWLALFVAPLLLKYYGEVWEPSRLEVQRLAIPLPGLKGPVRVAHLSDLQTDGIGELHAEVLEAANAFDPHLVLFTGDVMNHPSLGESVEGWLKGFKSRAGAYFVAGNVDGGPEAVKRVAAAGFRVLDDRAELLTLEEGTVGLVGLGLYSFVDRELVRRLTESASKADVRLAMSHVPDAAEALRGGPTQVHFSGHTHGGQVRLPGLPPIVTMSGVPRRIAAGGLHDADGLKMVVSRGLGWEGHIAPRVRTFCRPHLLLVELVP